MATLLVENLGNEDGTSASKFRAYAAIGYTDSDVTKGYYIQVRRYLLYYPPSGYDGSEGFQGTTFTRNWGNDFQVYGYDKASDGIYGDSGWVNVGWVEPNTQHSVTATCGYTGNQTYESSVTVSYTVPSVKTVTYDANTGEGAPAAQTDWASNSITITSDEPTKTGYTFGGWRTSAANGSVDYKAGDAYTESSSITLYAVWNINTYDVTYNANGGSNAPAAQVKTYGEDLTLTTDVPTKDKYDFVGWATTESNANAGTVAYESGATYTENEPLTLYAVWKFSYVEPTIDNLTLTRCDEQGNATAIGRYIKVEFDWTTDPALTLKDGSIRVKAPSGSGIEDVLVDLDAVSASSGNISKVVNGVSPITDCTVNVAIKDSEDSVATVPHNLEKELYLHPTISNINAIRTGEDRVQNDDGECGLITFDWSIDAMRDGSNSISNITVAYQEHGTGGYPNAVEVEYDASADASNATAFVPDNVLDSGKSYDFMITVEDKIASTVKYTIITYSFCTMDFRAGGKGIALGKYSGDDTFDVDMPTKFRQDVEINGRKYGENQILWQGAKYLNADSGVVFNYGKAEGEEPHKVSEQPHGIVLVFSYFEKNEGDTEAKEQDHSWSCHFVPKIMVELNNGGAHTFLMAYNSTLATFGAKHICISDTGMTGFDANSQAVSEATDCGSDIKFSNNKYVLRYVIGV